MSIDSPVGVSICMPVCSLGGLDGFLCVRTGLRLCKHPEGVQDRTVASAATANEQQKVIFHKICWPLVQ